MRYIFLRHMKKLYNDVYHGDKPSLIHYEVIRLYKEVHNFFKSRTPLKTKINIWNNIQDKIGVPSKKNLYRYLNILKFYPIFREILPKSLIKRYKKVTINLELF